MSEKRFISMLMAATMGIATVPGVVMAEEAELALENFNATTSAIMLNLSGVTEGATIDEEILENYIDVKKFEDGKVADVTDFDAKATDDTIVVVPNGGVEADVLYNVTLKSGLTDGTASMTNDAETEWFKVEVVFSDDFEVEYDAEGNPIAPYYMGEYNGNPKLLSKYWKIATGRINFQNGKMEGKNNGIYASVLQSNIGLGNKAEDYTVEARVSFPALDDRFEILMHSQYNDYGGHSKGYCFEISKFAASARDTSAKTAPVTITAKRNNTAISTSESFNLSYEGFTLRASAVGGNLQYYIDDNKLIDVTDASPISATSNIATFSYASPSNLAYGTIDDVYITKCNKVGGELKELAFGDFRVTDKVLEIDVENAQGDIVNATEKVYLYESGVKVNAEVEYENNKITVMPENGFKTGVLYLVSIEEGLNDDSGMTIAAENYEKGFTVKNVWEDDFSEDRLNDETKPYHHNYGEKYINTDNGTLQFKPVYSDTLESYEFCGTAWDRRFSTTYSTISASEEVVAEFDYKYTGTPNNLYVGVRTKDYESFLNYNVRATLMPASDKIQLGTTSYSYTFEEGNTYNIKLYAENVDGLGESTNAILCINDGNTETVYEGEFKGYNSYDETVQTVNFRVYVNDTKQGACENFTIDIDNLKFTTWKEYNDLVKIDNVASSTGFAGEEVTVSADIVGNGIGSDEKFSVIAASYDSDDRLISCDVQDNISITDMVYKFNASLSTPDKNTSYVKVFVWDSSLELNPYCEVAILKKA